MRSTNHIYTTSAELLTWLEEEWGAFVEHKSILVQIYDGSLNQERVCEISKLIKNYLADAVIIGSSTSGEIINGKLHDNTTLISITNFDSTDLEVFFDDGNSIETGKDIASSLIKSDTKCIIIFIDGYHYDIDQLLKSFNENGGDKVILAGGVSGDNYSFDGSSFVVYDTQTFSKGVVAVALNNPDLNCFTEHNFGWRSIGKDMIVTRADKNCVYEIDGKPALSVYAKYLGEAILKHLPESTMEFPLTFEIDGVQVARSVIDTDKDSRIYFSGSIKEGTVVRFALKDENSVINTTADIYVKASLHPIESIFTYSCASRKMFFNNDLEEEYTAISDLAPQAGFVTYGEFGNKNGLNHLFNVTSVFLGLSESSEIKNKIKTTLLRQKDHRRSAEAISHLIEATTNELNDELIKNANLINSLQQYKDALDKSTLVSKTDKSGIITYANDKFCELSGYSAAELIGKSHNIIRHPDTDNSVFKDMWATVKNKEIWTGMLQNRRKDGSSYYVHATIFPILDSNSEVVEYMALREDFTSMILYERSLEEQQERMHQILDNQDSIVVLTTEDGHVTFLNKKFFDCFDFKDINDFLNQHQCLCELFVDENASYLGCGTDCHLDNEELAQKNYIVDKDNNILTFRIGTKKLFLDGKDMYLSTLTNITEIENSRLKAEETKNMKSDFLANMSHEIRTPMNGIIGFAGLLSESVLNEEQRQYLDVIQNSADMLLGVVNGILDFSKIEQGKMESDIRNINLFRKMEGIYMNFLLETQKKSIIYNLDVDLAINECLYADELHLKQVLSNLINNAIKFTPEGKKILISARLIKDDASSQKIEFCVEDTGIGISKSRQEKIFEAFLQEDTSTTREFGGTGLGLSISSSLVALMGSKIDLSSEKGVGSKFSFVLNFDKCVPDKGPLSKLLGRPRIQMLANNQYSDEATAYLESFGIKTNLLSIEKLKTKEHDIIIVFEKDEALALHNEFNAEQALIVCIDESSEISESYSNLQMINCFSSCSTRLYNILYQYAESTTSDIEAVDCFDGSHLDVLVADDNEVNQMLIKALLNKYNISSFIVDNGEEAFKHAKEKHFDLILMDINMPIMNGVDATKMIIQEAQINRNTPIVALTSNVLEEDVEMFKKAGMYSHIGKPIKNIDVHTLLSDLFNKNDNKKIFKMSNKEIEQGLEKAGKLLELSPEIMKSLLKKFLLTAEKTVEQMQKAETEKSYDEVLEQTHKLKGASSSLCMYKITDISTKIENEVKANVYTGVYFDINQLNIFIKNIKSYFVGEIDGK